MTSKRRNKPTARDSNPLPKTMTSNRSIKSKSNDDGSNSNPSSFASRSNPVWSMGSLMAALPESPSPVCNTGSNPLTTKRRSPHCDEFLSQMPSHFSPSRNQNFRCSSNGSKASTSTDEWVEHVNTKTLFRTEHSRREKETTTQNQKKSATHSITGRSRKHRGLTLASVIEEGSSRNAMESHRACAQSTRQDSAGYSPEDGRRKLMSRPKSYKAFLDDVQKLQIEAEVDAWKKVQNLKLVDKLRRREDEISGWENEETREAMEEMKKVECKLEKKRAKILEKTRKRISRAKMKANKKKTMARRSTIDKFSVVSKVSAKILNKRCSLWIKLMKIS